MKKYDLKTYLFAFVSSVSILASTTFGQMEKPPAPSAPRAVHVPAIQTSKLDNKLPVVVVRKSNVPLVTVALLVKSGANAEGDDLAGLANTTASLLTKGTKLRSATKIAEEMEFLGGNINTGAGWNSSDVSINVTSDKLDQAMAIMADVILHPAFAQSEIDLFKKQTTDELKERMAQPSGLASFVASRYSYGEHVALGIPESLERITRADIVKFHTKEYAPENSVLIFTGDITPERAKALAAKLFGAWKNPLRSKGGVRGWGSGNLPNEPVIKRMLVVDVPDSGQAAVTYAKHIHVQRQEKNYYDAIVANSVLGGGYSARLNLEIRIKRGLSYGAGSSLQWRGEGANFSARAQTKNVSAAQVAGLVEDEIAKLTDKKVDADELDPRKATLTGDFGRSFETTGGLANKIEDLYIFGLPPSELNTYIQNVESATDTQVKQFAASNFRGGDMIIVGDAKIFMDDLKKRFPKMRIEVIKIDDLDLGSISLRKK